ncbi:hypothetical protein DEO72_LG1g2318 [Vigna unguiculata]|uniref:Uncharacterized protein n=1 Tax=Vigna unguiculata TaxID=3917 RepID=A0A4D6KMD5_VIGUN|nr:hypothetical protein DEO72_LG1g2318 [Vigna unguiculata]
MLVEYDCMMMNMYVMEHEEHDIDMRLGPRLIGVVMIGACNSLGSLGETSGVALQWSGRNSMAPASGCSWWCPICITRIEQLRVEQGYPPQVQASAESDRVILSGPKAGPTYKVLRSALIPLSLSFSQKRSSRQPFLPHTKSSARVRSFATFKLARSGALLHLGSQVTHIVLLFRYLFSSVIRSLSCCARAFGVGGVLGRLLAYSSSGSSSSGSSRDIHHKCKHPLNPTELYVSG